MELFYLILLILSFLFLIADLAVYLAFNMKNFGENWEILKGKNAIIDLQILFPKNLTLILMFIFSFSLCGFLLGKLLQITGFLSAPCGFVFAMLVNITAVKLFPDFFERANGKKLPRGDLLNGFEGVVTEQISTEDYGRISITYNQRKYDFYALSANETTLEAGTRVVVIDEIDGFCYVEGISEIYDILEEKHENAETTENNKTVEQSEQKDNKLDALY